MIELKKKNLRMVIKTAIAPKYENAVMQLIHSSGLGALNPNTIVMPWPQCIKDLNLLFFYVSFYFSLNLFKDWKQSENEASNFIKYIKLANSMQFHIIVLKPDISFDGELSYIHILKYLFFNSDREL